MSRHPRQGSALLMSAAALFTFAVPRSCAPVPAPVVAPVAAPAPAPVAPVEVSAEVQRVVDLTNAERAARGLGLLSIDGRLVAAAQKQSSDMATVNNLSHSGTDGSSPKQRMVSAGYPARWWSENVAAGYPTADEVMVGWMDSSGHRKNILNTRVVHIGVAVVHSADGTAYWTMDLGSGG